MTAICCGFVIQLVSTVDKVLIDSASRGPYVVAELLMIEWLTDRLFVSTCMKRIIALSADALTSVFSAHADEDEDANDDLCTAKFNENESDDV